MKSIRRALGFLFLGVLVGGLTILLVGGLALSAMAADRAELPGPSNNAGAPAAPGFGDKASAGSGQAELRVAGRQDATAPSALSQSGAAKPNEHPLMPALRWAKQGLAPLQNVKDYSATLIKRERIGGKLNEHEYLFVKVRHQPFSVYIHFLAPAKLKGQEVIYVEGQNNGNMWAHPAPGMQEKLIGTVSLKPDGAIAMNGQRYPLTELGLLNLVRRLVEVAEQDINYGECDVKFYPGAKLNGRTCTCIQVVHPVPRRNFLFHLARIFVDDELNVPIRYEAYDWPKEANGQPELMEEYTYVNLKMNPDFSDVDFSIKNPNYKFR